MDYFEIRANSRPLLCREDDLLLKAMGLADRLEAMGHARLARKLRCCGRCRPHGPNGELQGFPCNSKVCPACGPYLAYQRREQLQKQALREFGPTPAFEVFTLTPPHGPLFTLSDQVTWMRKDFARLRTRQHWKKPGGCVDRTGMICGTEFTNGRDGQGHPHLHGIVFGHDLETVKAVAQWVVDTWLKVVPGTSPLAQHIGQDLAGVALDWRQALNYAAKGNPIRAEWRDDFLHDAVAELSGGRHHIGSYGLLSTRRRPRKGGTAMPDVCPRSGNPEKETR